MTSAAGRPVEANLVDLFEHLGIEKAHIAAGRLGLTDWQGLATRHPDRYRLQDQTGPAPREHPACPAWTRG